MDDLISRQAAIDAIKELCEHYTPTKSVKHPHMNFVIEELERLPSAEPEIITCENCKHGNAKPIADGRRWCDRHGDYLYYCSDAERRTDDPISD